MSLFVKKHYQPPSTRFALLAAIAVASRLAALGTFLKRMVGKRKQVPPGANTTLVIGTHDQFNGLLQLLKHAIPAQQIIGRLSVDTHDKQSSLGNYADIEMLLKKHQPANIILCEGSISFADVLRLTEQIGNSAQVWFHSEGSSSIVSSQDKSEMGGSVSPPKEGMVNR